MHPNDNWFRQLMLMHLYMIKFSLLKLLTNFNKRLSYLFNLHFWNNSEYISYWKKKIVYLLFKSYQRCKLKFSLKKWRAIILHNFPLMPRRHNASLSTCIITSQLQISVGNGIRISLFFLTFLLKTLMEWAIAIKRANYFKSLSERPKMARKKIKQANAGHDR